MSLLPESPAFTTAYVEVRSPSNIPNLFPNSRAQLLLSGTRHSNYLLCFWETDFLISQRPSGPLGKPPDCSVYLSFIHGVVTTFSKSFPFPCNGNDHEHSLKALWDPLVKICCQLRAISTQDLFQVPRAAPLWVQIPTGHLKHNQSRVKLPTCAFLASEVFREQEQPWGWVNKLCLKKFSLQP